jgi:dTMP kinase
VKGEIPTSNSEPIPGAFDEVSRASYRELFADRFFRRFFLSQGLSSFGDWLGLVAILALVGRITRDEFAVAAMLLARLAPSLIFGPISGVLADRWNRKRVMVFCDLGRGALVLTLPFVESVARVVPLATPLLLLFLVSALLEMLTLLWLSAKDSALPEMVPEHQLNQANSVLLTAAYGTFPVSAFAFAFLASVSGWLGQNFSLFSEFELNVEHLAFFIDGFTFMVSAILVATLLIPSRVRSKGEIGARRLWRDLLDGLSFILGHPRLRPWVGGIGMIFVGVGSFLAISIFYIQDILGAGSAGFGLMVAFVGGGLVFGVIFSGFVTRFVERDVFFTMSVFGLGLCLFIFGSVGTLTMGLFVGAILGTFAGFAYPAGLTLVQENSEEKLRGRTVGAMHTVVRLALVSALAAAPAMAKLVDQLIGRPFLLLGQIVDLTGARVVLWLGGLSVVFAGIITTRAIAARWRGQRLSTPGIFLVFEGGEGSGKTTQMFRLARFLESRGRRVVMTREPGGTEIGLKIRQMLLDQSSDELSPKAEALLYAADRAQHADQKVRPALTDGAIVISDRYIDSSLAYQGVARGLGVDRILGLSVWATEALMPDLVFLLDQEPGAGLGRMQSDHDRMESQDISFHHAVRSAYLGLARRYPQRFVVIDASRSPDDVAKEIQARVMPYLEDADRARVGSDA